MDEEILKTVIENEKKIKSIEDLKMKKVGLEIQTGLCENDAARKDLERFVNQLDAGINKLKGDMALEKGILDMILSGVELEEYQERRYKIYEEYSDCKNCIYTHRWPDSTKISPEDNVFCTLYPEFDPDGGIDECLKADFKPYSPIIEKDYNKAITYINKKINEKMKAK